LFKQKRKLCTAWYYASCMSLVLTASEQQCTFYSHSTLSTVYKKWVGHYLPVGSLKAGGHTLGAAIGGKIAYGFSVFPSCWFLYVFLFWGVLTISKLDISVNAWWEGKESGSIHLSCQLAFLFEGLTNKAYVLTIVISYSLQFFLSTLLVV